MLIGSFAIVAKRERRGLTADKPHASSIICVMMVASMPVLPFAERTSFAAFFERFRRMCLWCGVVCWKGGDGERGEKEEEAKRRKREGERERERERETDLAQPLAQTYRFVRRRLCRVPSEPETLSLNHPTKPQQKRRHSVVARWYVSNVGRFGATHARNS